MDDFFKILIWLIIIISFFSSFFKKKKTETKPSKKKPDNPYRNQNEDIAEPKQENAKNDIMKEIERLFKGEPPDTKPVETKTKDHYDSSWHQETKSEHEQTPSEHVMETSRDLEKKRLRESTTMWKDKRIKVSSKIEEEAERFEKFLSKKEEFDQISFRTIKEGLKHPKSLKEFIVISEILGKPKSLRRLS